MSVAERRRVSARRDSLLGDQPGAFAVARFVRVTPQKARRVVDLVRGQPVDDALAMLQFAPQAAAETVYKMLESAVANARGTARTSTATSLVVSRAMVDEGPTLKRFRPRAQGRACRIRKRTSHITVVVSRARGPERHARRHRWPIARARRAGPAKWDRRSTRTGSGSASPPTTRAAGTPATSTRPTSVRTSRSAACWPRAWTAPASPRSRSSAPVTGSASTSTPPARASSSAAAAPRPSASAASWRS